MDRDRRHRFEHRTLHGRAPLPATISPLPRNRMRTPRNPRPLNDYPACAGPIAISPTSVNLQPGGTQPFAPTVTGASNTAVRWAATGGTISPSGLYTAGQSAGDFSVTATSAADTSKSASAAVHIRRFRPSASSSPIRWGVRGRAKSGLRHALHRAGEHPHLRRSIRCRSTRSGRTHSQVPHERPIRGRLHRQRIDEWIFRADRKQCSPPARTRLRLRFTTTEGRV